MNTPASIRALAVASVLGAAAAWADTPAQLLSRYTAQAGVPAAPQRGQQLFTARHGGEWACASCHGALPTQPGRHAATGKTIEPLAPAFNARRFTEPGRTEKWFRRNCKDVLGRECSAGEKADVLAWLLSLNP